MSSSLSDLLAKETFHRTRQSSLRDKDHSIAIPLYICHTRTSSKHRPRPHRDGSSSRKLAGSESSVFSELAATESPAIDQVSVRAVVSILSGYIGRYVKDETFREKVRENCLSCLASTKVKDRQVVEKLEMGIESVDRLVARRETNSAKRLRDTVQVLSIVVASSNNDPNSNSRLSSCANLYLAIVCKLERNDVKSARHLLQVFYESPFLARTHLVPDLWEHFFLPHLLHLKVWFTSEVECLGDSEETEKEKKIKALSKVYNEQVDKGTVEFASYYKKWLKVGVVGSPAVPVVPLPARPYRAPRRSSMDSCSTRSSVNKSLYNAVFGSTNRRQSSNSISRSGTLKELWELDEEYDNASEDMIDGFNNRSSSLHEHRPRRRSSSQHERTQKQDTWRDTQKPENFRFFACQQSLPLQLECSLAKNHSVKNSSIRKKEENANLPAHFIRAIEAVSSSENLTECEVAIRIIAKFWLDSQPNPVLESSLSKSHVIEGMLEVLFASEDEEVLELVLSILAELVTRNELNRLIVANADPQLEVFRRHLRSSSLFLKAAALLYLTKPKAKQMLSVEWVPLVLRVMEFGNQPQTLFSVRCSPMAAALYLLGQLLTGFDDDRNLDNARQVVCLGGLAILAGLIVSHDTSVRLEAVAFVSCCVRADGSCRNYLAESLSFEHVLELVVLECRRNPGGPVLSLLVELLCLNRRTQINRILEKVKQGWNGFNTMHVLFAYLQKAKPEDRPLVAAILLQLDLLEDPSKLSIYREEAIEAIISALDCLTQDQKVQEKSAKALNILGGRFSNTGEASTENWLLEKAGFHDISTSSYQGHESRRADEEAEESWQRKAAAVLLRSGGREFLAALSASIANGVPTLSRASLVTVSWMFVYLRTIGDENMQSMACSALAPRLVESLNHDKDVEGRVIASYSLLNLSKSSAECVSMIVAKGKDQLLSHLNQLGLVTWTANELLSIITI